MNPTLSRALLISALLASTQANASLTSIWSDFNTVYLDGSHPSYPQYNQRALYLGLPGHSTDERLLQSKDSSSEFTSNLEYDYAANTARAGSATTTARAEIGSVGAKTEYFASGNGRFYSDTSNELGISAQAEFTQLYQVTSSGAAHFNWSLDGTIYLADALLNGDNDITSRSEYAFQARPWALQIVGIQDRTELDLPAGDYHTTASWAAADDKWIYSANAVSNTTAIERSGTFSYLFDESDVGNYFVMTAGLSITTRISSKNQAVLFDPNELVAAADFMNTARLSATGAVQLIEPGTPLTGEITAVPLPATAWLLLGGIGAIAGWRRNNRAGAVG